MNWGEDNATPGRREPGKPASGPDPLRRKVMSALASVVDKHRWLLEEYDEVVITIHLSWRNGKVREMVVAVLGRYALPRRWGSGPFSRRRTLLR